MNTELDRMAFLLYKVFMMPDAHEDWTWQKLCEEDYPAYCEQVARSAYEAAEVFLDVKAERERLPD